MDVSEISTAVFLGLIIGTVTGTVTTLIIYWLASLMIDLAPTRKEWVGLTDDDVSWADGHSHGNTTWTKQKAFSRAIEAKLKEKNHGSV